MSGIVYIATRVTGNALTYLRKHPHTVRERVRSELTRFTPSCHADGAVDRLSGWMVESRCVPDAFIASVRRRFRISVERYASKDVSAVLINIPVVQSHKKVATMVEGYVEGVQCTFRQRDGIGSLLGHQP